MTIAPAPAVEQPTDRALLTRWLLGSRSDPRLLRPALLTVLTTTGTLYAWVFWTAVHSPREGSSSLRRLLGQLC
jgi:hypothetical protein